MDGKQKDEQCRGKMSPLAWLKKILGIAPGTVLSMPPMCFDPPPAKPCGPLPELLDKLKSLSPPGSQADLQAAIEKGISEALGHEVKLIPLGQVQLTLGKLGPLKKLAAVAEGPPPDCPCLECALDRAAKGKRPATLPFPPSPPREVEAVRDALRRLEAWLLARGQISGRETAEIDGLCFRLDGLTQLAHQMFQGGKSA